MHTSRLQICRTHPFLKQTTSPKTIQRANAKNCASKIGNFFFHMARILSNPQPTQNLYAISSNGLATATKEVKTHPTTISPQTSFKGTGSSRRRRTRRTTNRPRSAIIKNRPNIRTQRDTLHTRKIRTRTNSLITISS